MEDHSRLSPKALETRGRIIKTAMRLFADEGFDAVSLRQITSESESNIAAVNYHFGSKDNLIREVFRALAKPVNVVRLSALDDYEKEAGDGPIEIEKVVRALVEPTIRFAADERGGYYLSRLLLWARVVNQPNITSALAEQYDEIFHRFVGAFSRALPGLSYEDICWRYDFAIGALMHSVGYFDGTSRMKRVTAGVCDTNNIQRIIDELVAYCVAGLRAPMVAGAGKAKRGKKAGRQQVRKALPNSDRADDQSKIIRLNHRLSRKS